MSLDLRPALRLFQETLMFLLLCFIAVFSKTSLACREIFTRLKRGKEQKWNINPDMAQCKEIPDSFYISSCGRKWNSLTVGESDAEITAATIRERKLEEKDLLQSDLILIRTAEHLWEPFLLVDMNVQKVDTQLYAAGGCTLPCHQGISQFTLALACHKSSRMVLIITLGVWQNQANFLCREASHCCDSLFPSFLPRSNWCCQGKSNLFWSHHFTYFILVHVFGRR